MNRENRLALLYTLLLSVTVSAGVVLYFGPPPSAPEPQSLPQPTVTLAKPIGECGTAMTWTDTRTPNTVYVVYYVCVAAPKDEDRLPAKPVHTETYGPPLAATRTAADMPPAAQAKETRKRKRR